MPSFLKENKIHTIQELLERSKWELRIDPEHLRKMSPVKMDIRMLKCECI
jgi:hypothetical protein